MHYTTLGRTGLKVSVAGLGTGGFSRLGLKSGLTEDQSARLIHEAVGLGVNFIDTAPSYGTEGVVGKALKTLPRDQVVVATKAQIHRNGEWATPARVVASLDKSLRDHGHRLHRRVQPARRGADEYDYALDDHRAGAASSRRRRARSGTSASPRTRSSISPTRRSSARCAIRSGRCSWWASPCCTRARARTCFRSRARRASARC